MAGRLSFSLRMLCATLLVGFTCHGYGQGAAHSVSSVLADPTRPPAVFIEGDSGDDAKANEPPPVGLQAVVIRKGAKPVAVINGQTVQLGDKIGDAKLVKLNETEAVLQGPNGREVIRMTPAAERTVISKPASGSVPKSGKAGSTDATPKNTKSKLTK